MADPYLNAVRTLAGPKAAKKFEEFCTILARHRWGHDVVRRSSDKEGLFDILVQDPLHPEKFVAQIECKAYQRNEITSLHELDTLVRTWDVSTLRKRVQKLKALGSLGTQSFIATTVEIPVSYWLQVRKKYKLVDLEIWDAHALATFLANDATLASIFFPEMLPNSSTRFAKTSLEALIERGGAEIGLPNIRAVLDEPMDMATFVFEQPILLYGPPNIGKTTLAARQGWLWLNRADPAAHAFFLNARFHTPNDVGQATELVDPDKPMLVIVDDVHFAGPDIRNWVIEMDRLYESRPQGVQVLWVSRDRDIASKLSGARVPAPLIEEFPLDRVVSLFLIRLDRYAHWQRILAALEGQLDPRVAKALQTRGREPRADLGGGAVEEFTRYLAQEVDDLARASIVRISELLGDAYEGYLNLLPFGSLGCTVEQTFLNLLDLDPITAVERMRREGLVTRRGADDVVLTEHPFQVRRQLKVLASASARTRAHGALMRWLSKRVGKPIDVDARSISDVTFALYCLAFIPRGRLKGRLKELFDFAEWSGVREPLAGALGFLKELAEVDSKFSAELALGDDLTLWWLKLARGCYPEDEQEFRLMLREAQDFWQQKREIAEASDSGKAGSTRLDTILYELGYIEYLMEEYEAAAETFTRSVDASLRVIEKGMLDDDPTHGRDARFALAHIWIAALLERSAALRAVIREVLLEKRSFHDGEMKVVERLVGEMAKIWKTLAVANAQPRERSGEAYVEALSAVRSSWQLPKGGKAIGREPWMDEHLARHERNSWAHALETSCWPALYGMMRKRISSEVPLREYEGQLKTPAPAVGLPRYRTEQIELLVRWAEDPERADVERDALAIAALMRAGGGYEYFGDLLLLAWRAAEKPETRQAIQYFLTHRVPSIGFNGLAQLAVAG
jgi:tetratricopeptide (TPR) repeat protein